MKPQTFTYAMCQSLSSVSSWHRVVMLHRWQVIVGLTLHWPCITDSAAVRFLMRTLRNVLYVRVGKRYVRLWRSQVCKLQIYYSATLKPGVGQNDGSIILQQA